MLDPNHPTLGEGLMLVSGERKQEPTLEGLILEAQLVREVTEGEVDEKATVIDRVGTRRFFI